MRKCFGNDKKEKRTGDIKGILASVQCGRSFLLFSSSYSKPTDCQSGPDDMQGGFGEFTGVYILQLETGLRQKRQLPRVQ
ncbi:hypothetical protein XELAEV_18007049mg [Xenopus laevis]|uniref:Uncharacterized protein n=1 Tax=Xenopus laevis TaxID=8355 RepID=A0A974E0D0_XENLA|nr:hypothetical protein XELAEV_18007049mg [Xenopus laevis]